MRNRRFIFAVFCLFLFIIFVERISAQVPDTTKKRQHFELSFGSSLLFISNSDVVNIQAQSAIVIPTSAMLFFAELRPLKKVRIPFFFNIPTETKHFLVNNILTNEKAAPTFGTGLEFKLFQVKIDDKSIIDMELGPLASFGTTRNGKVWFAPLIAGRLRVMRGENFVMYLGGSYAFGVNALGLLYGTGTIF